MTPSVTCSPVRHDVYTVKQPKAGKLPGSTGDGKVAGTTKTNQKDEDMCNIHCAYGAFACKLALCGVCGQDLEAERRTKRESDDEESEDSFGDAEAGELTIAEKRKKQVQRGLKNIPEKLQKVNKINARHKKYESFGGFPKSFEWLMEHLVPVQKKANHIKGCELIFPDTCFIDQKGAPRMVIKMDKDQQTLVCARASAKKIEMNYVRRDFQNTFRARQQDTQGIFYHRYGPDFAQDRDQAQPMTELLNQLDDLQLQPRQSLVNNRQLGATTAKKNGQIKRNISTRNMGQPSMADTFNSTSHAMGPTQPNQMKASAQGTSAPANAD